MVTWGFSMLKKNIRNTHKKHQKHNISSKNSESFFIKANNNPDLVLLDCAQVIVDLEAQKEAVQYTDNLMTDDESRNHCVIDAACRKSQELNLSINYQLSEMATYQAFTMAGIQAKARAFKAVTVPISLDEGVISYEANLLLSSLIIDILGGVKQ